MPLLSREASEKRGIVKRLDQVIVQKSEAVNPKGEFPKLFTGLGKTKLAYKIKLQEDAVPLALTTPRKVRLPGSHPRNSSVGRAGPASRPAAGSPPSAQVSLASQE